MMPSQLSPFSRKLHPLISIIVPVFNEELAIVPFLNEVLAYVRHENYDYEILFINDGSKDGTLLTLLVAQRANPQVRVIDLSRNFGKEAAMTAGLDHAKGDAVIVIDVDLQEPPELIPQMIERWREGYDVVYGRRVSRAADGHFKRLTAGGFYTLFNRMSALKIPDDVGDFRLMDRSVILTVRQLPERVRFMKGLYAWVGFKTLGIDFERQGRHAGVTRFNYWHLWNFALDGITSFSTVPLRVWSYFGIAIALLALGYGAFIVGRTLFIGRDLPGYASLLTAILFLGGVQLIGLGVIGEYLGRVFLEVKQRPIYIVANVYENLKPGEKELNNPAHSLIQGS